ncbi:hypothetical protein CDAR_31411 [Caerostris darwini]|uniref:NADH dehydrogenase [ubiquinone] 1 alpha subcomplex subunit 12 n=1 Tax=Caerostris darwini TaxID=1538125 RepID=A0AAV4SU05_9ARAC|nr:hypothetical protein CDAR_31411 [Caerostris darwini]
MLSKKRKLFQRCGMSGCMRRTLLNHSFSTRNSIMCYRNYVVEEKETLPKVWHEWLHGEELFLNHSFSTRNSIMCYRNYVVEEKETLPKVWHEWLHGEELF